MILSMAQTNPVMFGMVADTPAVSQQLERMGRLKELLETDQEELQKKQRDDWIHWVSQYRLGNRTTPYASLDVTFKLIPYICIPGDAWPGRMMAQQTYLSSNRRGSV